MVSVCRVLLVQREDPEAPPITFDLPHSVAFLHIANCWEVGDWVHVALCRYGNECASPSYHLLRDTASCDSELFPFLD